MPTVGRRVHPFQIETSFQSASRWAGERPAKSVDPWLWGRFFAPLAGSFFAIVLGMNNTPATPQMDATVSFVRVVRGFAEASLVALAFAGAILLIGMPIALLVRGLHEGLSWLVGLGGHMSALVQALVSVSSVVGGLVIAAVFATLLVRFFRWRHTFRAHVISRENPHHNATPPAG
jgi:hypothetical protein